MQISSESLTEKWFQFTCLYSQLLGQVLRSGLTEYDVFGKFLARMEFKLTHYRTRSVSREGTKNGPQELNDLLTGCCRLA